MTKKAFVAEWKKEAVDDFAKRISKAKVVGVVDLTSLPAAQFAGMRKTLRGKVDILMGRKRLFKLAIDKVKDKPGIESLKEKLSGIPAFILTSENPFVLYKMLEKSKSNAFAKAGSIAPNDILIKAGPTSFAPGPIIGELGGVGLKAGIENGKVAIKQDAVVAKAGSVINDKLASILMRLGITPIEIGLNMTYAYADGAIFDKKILAVDESKYIADITQCARDAFNLAFSAVYVTADNRELLIQKAFTDAKSLAYAQNIMADAVRDDLIA
jgi:large subunit ribosomal protein L10